MWHGPAVGALLVGFTPEQAAAHPVAGAHSAWELVLHMAAWAELAALRLAGGAVDYPPADVDWPSPPAVPTADGWAAAQSRLAAAYDHLAELARALPAGRLAERVAGQEHTVAVMLDGVVEHGTYHGGQLALLRRAHGLPAAPDA
jgi:uncharacterized damage-inducible protein DinB